MQSFIYIHEVQRLGNTVQQKVLGTLIKPKEQRAAEQTCQINLEKVMGWLMLCWINALECERSKSPADSHVQSLRLLGPSAVLSLSGVKILGLLGQLCLVTVARLSLMQKSQLSQLPRSPFYSSCSSQWPGGNWLSWSSHLSVHAFLLSTFSN